MTAITPLLSRITGITLLAASCFCHAAEEGDTTTMNISGTLVDAPECTVNGDDQINVDFGDDVLISRINSGSYKKKLEYTVSCGDLAKYGLTMTISGTGAGFGSGLLSAGRDGLGIQLYHGTQPVSAGELMSFGFPHWPVLYAELVKNDSATLDAGSFSSTATMVITYQ